MPAERVVFDGLWRCLCPSVDAAALSRALQSPSTPRRHQSTALSRCANLQQTCRHVRNSSTFIPRRPNERLRQKSKREDTAKTGAKSADANAYNRYLHRVWKRNPELPLSVFSGGALFGQKFDIIETIETKVILEVLRELVRTEGQYHAICNLIQFLVTRRSKKPDAFLYECLIKANVDPHHGSAEVVGDLLQEMLSKNIAPTTAVYHGILDVLAVHPDYTLRSKILDNMKKTWLNPTVDGALSVTIGLLRDGQYELALDKLEDFQKTGLAVPAWFYDIFIYTFGDTGAHQEALMVLQHRLQHPDTNVSNNVWSFLLSVFSRDSYYEGVKYVWDRVVTSGVLQPPDSVVLNVLNTASKNGDGTIAMLAVKMLSNRGRKLGLHHFEPLLEIHIGAEDLRMAFLTLCLMTKAGLQPDLSSTRPIFQKLRGSSDQTKEALAILHDLEVDQQVPIAAFNVVLEATMYHHDFKTALDLYRNITQVCSSSPDLETFNLLLDRCTLHKSMRFLLAEMEAFSVKPDRTSFNHAINISTSNHNYEPAFRYLEKMRSNGSELPGRDWWMDRKTAMALMRRCILAGDRRANSLLQECKRRGFKDMEEDLRPVREEVRRKREEEERLASKTEAAADMSPELASAQSIPVSMTG